MPDGIKSAIHKSTKQDSYGHVTTIPLVDISVATLGIATIERNRAQEGYALAESPTSYTATIAGVTGTHEAQINGARTCTRISDYTFSIGVNTDALTFDATAATVTVQVADAGAGAPLDRGNAKDSSLDFSGS